jgi:hypothetical protein
VLADDPALNRAQIEYEPDLLPDGRGIDFVVDRGNDNLYVEVKTVRPKTKATREVSARQVGAGPFAKMPLAPGVVKKFSPKLNRELIGASNPLACPAVQLHAAGQRLAP